MGATKASHAGMFQKGQSGNPGGVPKSGTKLRDAASEKSLDTLNTLVSIMEDEAASNKDRAYAANCVLDRAFGRPKQQVEVEDNRKASDLSDEQLVQIISGAANGAR